LSGQCFPIEAFTQKTAKEAKTVWEWLIGGLQVIRRFASFAIFWAVTSSFFWLKRFFGSPSQAENGRSSLVMVWDSAKMGRCPKTPTRDLCELR
jgi:hypothetical protein